MKEKKVNTAGGFSVVLREVAVVREPGIPYTITDEQFVNPGVAARFLRSYLSDKDEVEHFIVVLLNTNSTPIGVHLISKGALDAVYAHPREVFRAAVIAGAASVILAHNHPSGRLDPSREDDAITRQLVDAGRVIDIRVLDHIIFSVSRTGDNDHYSYAAEGRL